MRADPWAENCFAETPLQVAQQNPAAFLNVEARVVVSLLSDVEPLSEQALAGPLRAPGGGGAAAARDLNRNSDSPYGSIEDGITRFNARLRCWCAGPILRAAAKHNHVSTIQSVCAWPGLRLNRIKLEASSAADGPPCGTRTSGRSTQAALLLKGDAEAEANSAAI